MRLCRVLGSVTQTIKHDGYAGHKLMVVEPVDPAGASSGSSFLAVDHAQAGAGDLVLVLTEGTGVRQLIGGQPPIRSLIVGVVDAVDCPQPVAHA